jgi:phage terminase large subunit-like protein
MATTTYNFTWHLSPKQREVFEANTRFRIVMGGRRFGKNEVETAAEIDYALNPSEYSFGQDDPSKVLVWHVAPTYRQAHRHGYKKVKEKLPQALIADSGGSEYSPSYIELETGGSIEFLSYDNPEGLQGEGVDLLCGDEWAYSDEEIWDADLRPMLLDSGGGAILISKPLGENHFYEKYARGATVDMPYSNGSERNTEWYSVHATSYDNPLIPESEIDNLKDETPERIFRREYLADPTRGGSVYDTDMFHWIAPGDVSDNVKPMIGVDPAATADSTSAQANDSDYWAVTVGYWYPPESTLYVADTAQKRGMTLKEGVSFIQQIVSQVDSPKVVVESNQSQRWLQQELADKGVNAVPVQTTRNKEEKLIDMSIPISNGTVEFIDWRESEDETLPYQDLRDQMLAFPEGSHDDLMDSLSLLVNHAPTGTSIFGGEYNDRDLW